MSNILLNRQADLAIRQYKCKGCKQVIVEAGSFKPEFPEYKEIRAIGAWKKEEVGCKPVYNPMYIGRPVAFVLSLKCKHCGIDNLITVPTSYAKESGKIKVKDGDILSPQGSRFFDVRKQ